MTTRRRVHARRTLSALILTLGCASANQGPRYAAEAGSSGPTPRPRRAGDVITAELLVRAGMGTGSGLDALARLRPELVRGELARMGAGPTSASPVLYVDGTRQGPIGLLADVRAEVIGELRYFRPAEALAWFGPGHEGGVVSVRVRKQ